LQQITAESATASVMLNVLHIGIESVVPDQIAGFQQKAFGKKREIDLVKKVMKEQKSERGLYSYTDVQQIMNWNITIPYAEGSTEIKPIPLEKKSEEWNKVDAAFHITMPTKLTVVGIEKICNPILRENWEHELKMVKKKNNNADLQYVKLMWNGTGSTPPPAIYSNEKGWMVNYSTDANLWGKGAYFSEDASYVCGKKKMGHLATNMRTKQRTIL